MKLSVDLHPPTHCLLQPADTAPDSCSCFPIHLDRDVRTVSCRLTDADVGTFSMFGRIGAPQKGAPVGKRMSTAAQHFLACGASLWRVATFKSSLGTARHSLAWGLCTPHCEIWTYNITFNIFFWRENLCQGSRIFTEHGLIGFKSGPVDRSCCCEHFIHNVDVRNASAH